GVFCARFRRDKNGLTRETGDALLDASDFRSFIKTDDTIVTDALGYARSSVFGFLDGRDRVIAVERRPFGRGIVCAAQGAEALSRPECWIDPAAAQPTYLRSFAPPPGSKVPNP
ncbi:MAG: hypothetical protein JXA71_18960, partial [Chitinispirillaceae bacterium]|nr:hypothetical protein [Chitinispirillaceae bacterium]